MNQLAEKNYIFFTAQLKRGLAALVLGVLCLAQPALADYVGEAQTTKFLDKATQDMIAARYQAGGGGLAVGDEISYIIQFTPVPGGTTEQVGGGAYVTDYIPAGTQVVNAQFVQDNGNGSYTQIAPPPPAEVKNFFVPHYSETGIFYSTDPRTAMYTNNASTTINTANGYAAPVGGPVAGYSIHNAWDASIFTPYVANPAAAVAGCAAPAVASTVPSPVAGPDAFIKGDVATGQGPWQRISYPGSTFGTALGVLGAHGGCIGGTATMAGWQLSSSHPLPASVNALRFAGGQTTVGQLFSVRITLRITQAIPAAGIINNSEVFGGDVSILNTGVLGLRSNIWRYVFPSVANASSNLMIVKRIVGMCVPVAPATTCTIQPYSGSSVPSVAGLNVRYEVNYLNGSGGVQSNVVLADTMPAGAALVAASASVLAGPNILPTTVLAAPVTGFQFAPLATLGSGAGGTVQYTLSWAVAPPVNVALPNTIKMTSTSVPAGASSTATCTPTALASLNISKTTSTPSLTPAAPSNVANYTITIPNTGGGIANTVTVKDTLPSNGLSTLAADRFSYLVGATTTATISNPPVAPATTPTLTTVAVTAVVTPPTVAPFREFVTFSLPVGTTLASGSTLTINFSATVGANIPASATPYLNDAETSYLGGATVATASSTSITNGVAPIMVTVPLTLSKSIDCVYVGLVCTTYSNGAPIATASKVKYRLSYANTSTAAIANVQLVDTLPANTTFVAGTAVEVGTVYGITPATATLVVAPLRSVLSFLPIASLPAGATGAVTFDVQLGAALAIPSGSYLTNDASIKSTLYPGGMAGSLTTSVLDQANLVVSKTTSTPSLAVNGVASYTIHVLNSGNVAATAIKIYDYLPFVGAAVNANTRFNYTATGAFVAPVAPSTLTAPPAPVASVGLAANVYPNSKNPNQQQVLWTFAPTQTLAAGASFDLTFTATAGAAAGLPAGATVYGNDVLLTYTSGATALNAGVNQVAPVTIPSNLLINKSIDCVYNTALTACNAYNGTGIIPVNAKLRYKLTYKNTALTAQTNVYLCDQITSNQAVALTATIATPTLAPTPPAPFTNVPVLGTPVTPANALCAFAALVAPNTGVAFSYPVIASLAANATGTLYYDLTTNAASGASIANTAKIVSVQAPAGEVSTVTAVALNVPALSISKTTSTANLNLTGLASYTLSVSNTGSAATTGLKIYDYLPYSGSLVDANKRFSYSATTAYSLNGVAFVPTTPIITAVSKPTIAPYSANTNQQQVLWDFGTIAANQLAPGQTLTITFTASVGSAMPLGNYGNSAGYEFASLGGPGANSVNGQAVVTVVSPPIINLSKLVSAFSDPVNGTTNPKFLPGGISEYSVSASNSGGVTDNNSLFITDSVPINTTMSVKDFAAAGSGPVAFVQGTPSSGLTYNYVSLASLTDDVDFFGAIPPAAASWGYVPVAGADGCDANVAQIRVNPKGVFVGSATTPNPNFTVRFHVCLK
ncbi:MAG: hypothetical protein RL358_347 [Pseudomonadota bacterium]